MHRVVTAFWVIGLLAALAIVGWHAPAAAQDATPKPAADEFPISPDPADCQVEPRTVDELIALWYGPGGSAVATPAEEAAATEVSIPIGSPADEATTADIVATVREVFACFETGDFLRATALFTDDLARIFGPGPGVSEEDARAFLAAPEPATEAEASLIVAIADVMVLADGRVGAFVVDRSADDGTHVGYVVLEHQGDRWLADEDIEFGGQENVEE